MIAIWPENAESLAAFLAAATQWRVVVIPAAPGVPGRLIRTGLDHAAVAAAIGFARRRSQRLRAIFDDVIAMEQAAIEAFAEAAP